MSLFLSVFDEMEDEKGDEGVCIIDLSISTEEEVEEEEDDDDDDDDDEDEGDEEREGVNHPS